MPILDTLQGVYLRAGHRIFNGVSPVFSGLPYTEFTYIMMNDGRTTGHLGIAPAEVTFLEHLFRDFKPRSIFIIGNSFAYSTFAIALLNPQAQIVALDGGGDAFTAEWIETTNRIAQTEGFTVRAVRGMSPEAVPATLREAEMESLDFVFVDGFHDNGQVVIDFDALAPYVSRKTIFAFHDVAFWKLFDGIDAIVAKSGLNRHLLYRTPSGIAILCHDDEHPALVTMLEAFQLGPAALPIMDRLRADGPLDQLEPAPHSVAPEDVVRALRADDSPASAGSGGPWSTARAAAGLLFTAAVVWLAVRPASAR